MNKGMRVKIKFGGTKYDLPHDSLAVTQPCRMQRTGVAVRIVRGHFTNLVTFTILKCVPHN